MLKRIALACALLVTVLAHAPLWFPLRVVQIGDEGYIAAFAWRMAEGRMLPYVDAVSHRGPLVYVPPALVALITGGDSAFPVRVCTLALALGTVALVYSIEKGAIACVLYSVAISLLVPAWIPYHSEHLVNLFTLGAFVMMPRALEGRRAYLAGALAMAPLLCKPVALYVVLVLGGWLAARRRSALVPFTLGAVAVLALVLARYAIAGELGTFVYYFFTYNAKIYNAPYTSEMARTQIVHWIVSNAALLAVLVALCALTLRKKRPDEERVMALLLVGALVASKLALRDFIHYYLPVVPWAILLFAKLAREGWKRFEGRIPRFAAIACTLLLLVIYGVQGIQKRPMLFADHESADLCKIVRSHSKDGDAMFVWGFRPWLYEDCKRKPASRYLFTSFVMGWVPWFDEPADVERTRVVPGSRELLLSDLAKSQPSVIVDDPIGWRTIEAYPDIAAFLHERYCLAEDHVWVQASAMPSCLRKRE